MPQKCTPNEYIFLQYVGEPRIGRCFGKPRHEISFLEEIRLIISIFSLLIVKFLESKAEVQHFEFYNKIPILYPKINIITY